MCPTDYVYQTVNDKGIKQALVIPEKMLDRINDSIITSYKQTIIDKAVTEVTYREYYSKDFKLNSDKLEIVNTEFKHDGDKYDYTINSGGDILLNASGTVRVPKHLSVGGYFHYGGAEFTDILSDQKTVITDETDVKINELKDTIAALEARVVELESKVAAL